MGPAGNLLPPGQQIHLLFPGADWKIGQRRTWSFAVGLGTTGTGSQVILKSRIEFEFGRKHNWVDVQMPQNHRVPMVSDRSLTVS
jgi:hypothetical protein